MAEQKLRKYELIYLVQPEAAEEERTKIAARVQAVLDEGGAFVLQKEEWGKRKLAYEIRKQNKAYYFYLVFVCKPGLTKEIERILRMLDGALRFQSIKLEEGMPADTIVKLQAEAAEAAKVEAAAKAKAEAAKPEPTPEPTPEVVPEAAPEAEAAPAASEPEETTDA